MMSLPLSHILNRFSFIKIFFLFSFLYFLVKFFILFIFKFLCFFFFKYFKILLSHNIRSKAIHCFVVDVVVNEENEKEKPFSEQKEIQRNGLRFGANGGTR